MTKRIAIFALISSNLIGASAYSACNPATTCYVDNMLVTLQTEIASIPKLPAGGTTGQVLAKANNNNYDTQWVTQYMVGQFAFGGVIFYVDSTGQHGLVAATADEPGTANYTWGLPTTLGTAQYQCANKTAGGYNNWIVPDKAQMTLLYTNRYPIGGSPNGGFSSTTLSNTSAYWTSTESDSPGFSWYMDFGLGYQNLNSESSFLSVRCIRPF
jgi:hypothetical protein